MNKRLWALPLLLTLLMGSVSLAYPHGRDQGSYAYAGWRLLEGDVPYRDVFVFKPPFSVFVHAVAQGLFGLDPVAIRVFDLGWVMATAIVVARLTQALGATFQAGIWAGVLVPLLYFQVDYWNIAQTDGWLVLPAALALLLVLQDKPWQWVLGGAFAGCAILFKYTAAAFGLPLLALLLLVDRRWERLLAFCVGAGGLIAVILVGLRLAGAWPAFIDSQFNLVPSYVSDRRKGRTFSKTLELLLWLPNHKKDVAPLLFGNLITVWFALAVFFRRWAVMAFLLSLTLVTVLMTVVQGKYYDYHYLPMFLPAAISGGIALDALRRNLQRLVPHFIAVGAVWSLIAVGLGFSTWKVFAGEAFDLARGARTRANLWKSMGRYRYRDYNVHQIEQTAAWIKNHTAPDEPIFTWTYEPELMVRAERRQISRFLYNYPFRVKWEVSDYDQELAEALAAEQPSVLVVGSNDAVRGVTGTSLDSFRLMQRHKVLGPFVRDNYCQIKKIGRYRIYEACEKP